MKQPQILSLNAIRGVASLLVVFSHLQLFKIGAFGNAQEGHFGVMIFFTLGGFLMGHLYLHKNFNVSSVFSYIVSRFSRIAPPYLIVIILSFVVFNYFDPAFPYAIDHSNIARHLLFVGNASVFWSIPPEVQFYILFIVIWFSVYSAVYRKKYIALAIVAIVSCYLVWQRASFPGTFVGSKLQYFIIGTFLGWLHLKASAVTQSVRLMFFLQLALLITFLFFMMGYVSMGESYWLDMIPALISGLTIFAFTSDSTPLDKILHWHFFQKMGDWSFSIYLLHIPILYIFAKVSIYFGGWAILSAILLVIMGSSLFSIYIEHPICARVKLLLLTNKYFN
ncbi:acyltransferase [Actimicrobium sp. CCI2.3]|uniref:acyltransferase family protein n=1 Tax=Actimicrobium sp. CCI2.3 TaxID=3048616 RepID=UPI002AB4A169|nr:acyltransferase [Actimicrobium sp. CCI2.3]MDY7576528.1 acyltransferase [Actimicrobium sp. CCI2.3]MEB0021495.1 acyltransferase [Actimicrobium sp. CCI2.3]